MKGRYVFGYCLPGEPLRSRFVGVVFAAGAVWILIGSLVGNRTPLLVAGLTLGVLGWLEYWWLWGAAYRIEVTGRTVRWDTILRSREVPLDALLGTSTRFKTFTCLTVRGERPLPMVFAGRGWTQFLDALNLAMNEHRFEPSATQTFFGSFGLRRTGFYERVEGGED